MYIVQELQTNNGVTSLVPAQIFEDRPHAEQAFYTACAYATVSSVEIHTIMMYTEEGAVQLINCWDRREKSEEE